MYYRTTKSALFIIASFIGVASAWGPTLGSGASDWSSATAVTYITFDEPDLLSSGAWSPSLARRYADSGVILPCDAIGAHRGACTVENLADAAALTTATTNVGAFHGGCIGVPAGFDAFRAVYHASVDALLTFYSEEDCGGEEIGHLQAPAVALIPGGMLRFEPLPAVGWHRLPRRGRSIHLYARDGRLVGLDNVTFVREAIASPVPAPAPRPLSPAAPVAGVMPSPPLAPRGRWALTVEVLPQPRP